MLANLLPGLRDLRTPLAVGYVWLTCLWLWFHASIPTTVHARGVIADLYALAALLPSSIILAALTFVAYLLGSIVEIDVARWSWLEVVRLNRSSWEAVADGVHKRLAGADTATLEQGRAITDAWRRAAPGRAVRRMELSPNTRLVKAGQDSSSYTIVKEGNLKSSTADPSAGRSQADAVLATDIRSHSSMNSRGGGEYWQGRGGYGYAVEWGGRALPVDLHGFDGPSAVDMAVLYAIRGELPDLATRLLIERPAVFDRYDRLMSEASIRVNICLPFLALVITLSVRDHWIWFLGVAVCALLLYQGLLRRSQANEVLLDAVATRLIESPTLLAVEAATLDRGKPAADDGSSPTPREVVGATG